MLCWASSPYHLAAPAEAAGAGLETVEDRLVAEVVVGVAEHERVLDPDEGLAQRPALREEGACEGRRQGAGRVGDAF